MRGKLIFVTGGVRSGKSSFAERITSQLGAKVTYVATAQAFDEEMEHRIELHRSRRPADWLTVEEPLNAAGVITEYGSKSDVIMLDCLTMLLSNLMFAEEQRTGRTLEDEFKKGSRKNFQQDFQKRILDEIGAVARAAREAPAHVVVVSNEVGLTLVSDNYLGRQYQELVGLANQIAAGQADEVYLVVAGYPLELKSGRSGNL